MSPPGPPAAGAPPDLAAWEAWSPEEATCALRDVRAPWHVAGGWALDLFLGRVTRAHGDLEVGVRGDRFPEVAATLDRAGLDLFVVGDGHAWPLADPGDDPRLRQHHQTWARERSTGRWRLDVFREPSDGPDWLCRRDPRLRMPWDRLVLRTPDGIPHGRPEAVLLFKAKAARPKDEADLAAVLPHLDPDARRWLAAALALVHPGHPWLAAVEPGSRAAP